MVVHLLATIFAAVRLGAPFTDGVVLQREIPVPVWGTADAGEKVAVSFAGQTKSAKADMSGKWSVTLDPMPASSEGRTLTVTSSNPTTKQSNNQTILHNILVGDVWFVAGQSNMDVPLVGNEPRYRDGHGKAPSVLTRLKSVRWCDYHNVWRSFTSENLRKERISAVAFYYGRELGLSAGVPIGLLCRHTGGLNIETWISRRGYELNGKLPKYLNWKRRGKDEWDGAKHTDGTITHWVKQPMVIHEEWVEPITPFACRGVVWYQGEQNAEKHEMDYDVKMDALLRTFEIDFANPALKFYFVQIPPPCAGVGFPESQQRFVRSHAKDGRVKMAVINDVASPVGDHGSRMEPVGRRLAYLALRYDYGFSDLVAESPVAVSCAADGKRMRVTLEHGEGLYVYNEKVSYDAPFQLAGADGVFKPAKIVNPRATKDWAGRERCVGEIMPNEIVLEADGVEKPVAVRYLHGSVTTGNVFNGGNLPLAPFDLAVDGRASGEKTSAGAKGWRREAGFDYHNQFEK